jgi:peptide/nickel transport system substrate-binding protein
MSVPNYANLANDLNSVPIMPKKIAANLSQADFDSGKAMIGTGPFKFVRRARPGNRDGEEPDYWGPSPNGTARSSAS